MRFLADENVEPIIVEWLRGAGHDVTEMRTLQPGTDDDGVLDLARTEARVLVMYDLDFGELVYRQGLVHAGIVSALQSHWSVVIAKLPSFVVVDDRKVRVRKPPLPDPDTDT